MIFIRPRFSILAIGCRYGQTERSLSMGNIGSISRYSQTASSRDEGNTAASNEAVLDEKKQGGMSRRLSQMTEDSVEQDGRRMRRAMEDGHFSEELKRRLEERIHDNAFRSENPGAFAQLNMPVSSEPSTPSCRIDPERRSQVQAKELAMWPPLSLGLALKDWKMLHYVCLMMPTSLFVVLALEKHRHHVDPPPMSTCE